MSSVWEHTANTHGSLLCLNALHFLDAQRTILDSANAEGKITASALALIRFCRAAWFLSRAAALSFSTLLHSSISSCSTSAVLCWEPSGRLLSVYTLQAHDVLLWT